MSKAYKKPKHKNGELEEYRRKRQERRDKKINLEYIARPNNRI